MNKQYDNFLKILNTAITGNVSELNEPDFKLLSNLAFQQEVAPIFLEGAIKYSEFTVAPVAVKAELISKSTSSVVTQTQNTAEFYSIYQKLISAGLKPIILKGLICRKSYGKLENHRGSGDEDIYIPKNDFPLCRRILSENGYTTEDENVFSERYFQKAQTVGYQNSNNSLKLEIHLNLFGTQNPIRIAMNHVFDEALAVPYRVDFDGNELYTLDPTNHYLFLLLHYLKHFMTTGAGIRHVSDLAVFGNKYKNEIDFASAEQKFLEFIGSSFYADTVKIMRLLGGTESSDAEQLDADSLCEDLLNGGTFGLDDKELNYASTFIFSKTGGSRFGLFRSVFPSYDLMAAMRPELYDKPWKLPCVYYKRIAKYLKNKRNAELEKDAIKKCNKRINLINNYGLKKK